MNSRIKAYCVDDTLETLHLRLVEIAELAQGGRELPAQWQCRLIYSGRNLLYRIQTPQGEAYVVKCFGALGLWRRLYYSYIGTSKARRSYLNALSLGFLEIGTALPLGYAEVRNSFGLISRAYYTSRAIEATVYDIHPHMTGWTAPSGFLPALAQFLAALHTTGVVHEDLSPGNILYRIDEVGTYHFSLVDVNRMTFLTRALSPRESAQNLSRLASNPSVSTTLAYYYALARGWDTEATIGQINAACDRFWQRRLGKLSARYAKRVYGIAPLRFLACYLLPYRWLCFRLRFANGASRRRLHAEGEDFYRRYLSAEDVRHTHRLSHGYGYGLPQH